MMCLNRFSVSTVSILTRHELLPRAGRSHRYGDFRAKQVYVRAVREASSYVTVLFASTAAGRFPDGPRHLQ